MTVVRAMASGAEFRFDSFFEWSTTLNLAARYGWRPTGGIVTATDGGSLFDTLRDGPASEEGNIILAQDARTLADAIERALPDIPNQRRGDVRRYDLSDSLEALLVRLSGGEIKERLRAFVLFCRDCGGIAT